MKPEDRGQRTGRELGANTFFIVCRVASVSTKVCIVVRA